MTESTTRFHRQLTRHDLVLRHLTVQEVRRVAPDMIRVTVAGDDLEGFVSDGAADHVKLFFPNAETGVITTPADGDPAAVISRDFTPLPRTDGDTQVLDLDFYTHEDPGPAASWALAAQPGAALAIGGPRGSRGMPEGADAFILVADETALPSASRWLDGIPAGIPVRVIATVRGDGDWVSAYLGGAHEVIVTASDPAAVLSALGPVGEGTFVWAAGDAAMLVPIRRHLRRTLGLPAAQVSVDGYWRSGVVAWDHHAPLDPTDPD